MLYIDRYVKRDKILVKGDNKSVYLTPAFTMLKQWLFGI